MTTAGANDSTTGSCLCGACAISFTGRTALKCLCYCDDCHKVSGSTFSTNLFVGDDALHLTTGNEHIKQFAKGTDAGNRITSFFCAECGTTLWRESTGFPGIKILKEGVLEKTGTAQPTVEYYTSRRPPWSLPVAGAEQKETTSKSP